jgi:Tol biopolymer transport system component
MGEVYRARDTKLGRDVAIKVLPSSLTNDPDRLARFSREAQLLASLNHPNIAAIFHVEETGDGPAIVMELVEGETLADRIARGPIPVDEALPIAKQIAEALEAAHEQGIIHRDLKPANIKLTPNGTVKVLDFGLAKLNDSHNPNVSNTPSALSMSPTITAPALMTGVGMLLGTAAYMAPEQAKGRAADRRSDMWAFGCVLYEVLTAVSPFRAADVPETLAAVLTSEPDFAVLPHATPGSVELLLRRCLRKNRADRLGDAGAARIEIQDAMNAPRREGSAETQRVGHRRIVRWSAALVIVAAALIAAVAHWRVTAVPSRTIRFEFSPPEGWTIDVTGSALGAAQAPLAISPDGRRVVFSAVDGEGRRRLWIRSLDSTQATPLVGTDGAMSPFWSPDSRFLGFFADAKLKKIDVAGGPPITLCDAPDGRGGSWSRDGVIVFSPSAGPLKRVAASGGVPADATRLQAGETRHNRPSFLPDGRHFFHYVVGPPGGLVSLASLDDLERITVPLGADAMPVIYSQGYVLFVRDGTLMAQPFDISRRELRGEPVPVAEQVEITGGPSPFNAVFSVSDDGVLSYRNGAALTRTELTWFDRQGKRLAIVGDGADYGDLELSPDGNRLAVSVGDVAAGRDLWIYDVIRQLRTRFTFGGGTEGSPVWSPDATFIAFSSNVEGDENIYQKSSTGTGREELLVRANNVQRPVSWSAGGDLVYESAEGGVPQLLALPLIGDRKAVPVLGFPTLQGQPQGKISPDGRWITYMSAESGRPEVYVATFPKGDGKWQVSTSGGQQPRWRRDGKEIFFRNLASNALMSAEVSGDATGFRVGLVRSLFPALLRPNRGSGYDVSPDGQRFIVNVIPHESGAPITVNTNWRAAFAGTSN